MEPVTFFDFEDFLQATRKPVSDMGARYGSRADDRRDQHWFQSRSLAHAEELARFGVPELEGRIRAFVESINLPVSSVERQTWQYDVAGDDVDVSRFLSGEPECMIRYETCLREGEGRFLTININGCVSGGVKGDILLRRGAAVLALVDLVESIGYRAEINAIYLNSGEINYCIPLKRAEEPFDLSRLTYAAAHPSMFRRHVFRLYETLPTAVRHRYGMYKGGGYGAVCDDPRIFPCDVYLPADEAGYFYSDEYARQWVERTLKRLNVID